MPRFFKRLFKFPQMDFETAVWEMTHLMIAPKKVFKNILYSKRTSPAECCRRRRPGQSLTVNVETRNTWHTPDPAFTYLLSFFLLLTSLAWSLAYTPRIWAATKLAFMFVFVHFLFGSLLLATIAYFLIGRLLAPGVAGLPGRRRQQGLFGGANPGATGDALEFGYCFDVSIRAFLPVYVLLYILQYVLMPAIDHTNRGSVLVANTLYLVAAIYWSLITFLGYNQLTFLHHTQLLLAPIPVYIVIWAVSTALAVNLEKNGVRWLFTGVDISR